MVLPALAEKIEAGEELGDFERRLVGALLRAIAEGRNPASVLRQTKEPTRAGIIWEIEQWRRNQARKDGNRPTLNAAFKAIARRDSVTEDAIEKAYKRQRAADQEAAWIAYQNGEAGLWDDIDTDEDIAAAVEGLPPTIATAFRRNLETRRAALLRHFRKLTGNDYPKGH